MRYRLCAFADEADSALSGQIAAMKRNQIGLLEIRGVDEVNIGDQTADKVRDIRAQLDANGIRVWSIGSPTGKIKLSDDFDAHLDQFKRLIEFGTMLDAKCFRLFSFYEGYDAPQAVIDRLGKLCDAAAGSGITLCLENEKGVYGDTPERVAELLNALPALRTVFDAANYVQSDVDPLAAWELLRDRARYIHIKDSRKDGTVVPAGKGDGKLDIIVPDYLRRGGDVMTMEPHLMEFSGLAGLEQEDDRSVVGSADYTYANNNEAFDAGVAALRVILDGCGATPRD